MNQKLIPFEIEAAKKGAKVVNSRGESVRIVCYDLHSYYDGVRQPVLALTKSPQAKSETSGHYCENGKLWPHREDDLDLFLVAEPKWREWREWREDEFPLGAVIRNKLSKHRHLMTSPCLAAREYLEAYEWKWPHEADEAFRICGIECEQ